MPDIVYTERLVVTHCWCGIALAIPENLDRNLREKSANGAYCPVGHRFGYVDTFEQALAREQQQHRATRDLLRAEERSHTATKGQATKLRKRIANGVCPCCHRHFANVERHVKTKHPDYEAPA
jgi:hypothetical protein